MVTVSPRYDRCSGLITAVDLERLRHWGSIAHTRRQPSGACGMECWTSGARHAGGRQIETLHLAKTVQRSPRAEISHKTVPVQKWSIVQVTYRVIHGDDSTTELDVLLRSYSVGGIDESQQGLLEPPARGPGSDVARAWVVGTSLLVD